MLKSSLGGGENDDGDDDVGGGDDDDNNDDNDDKTTISDHKRRQKTLQNTYIYIFLIHVTSKKVSTSYFPHLFLNNKHVFQAYIHRASIILLIFSFIIPQTEYKLYELDFFPPIYKCFPQSHVSFPYNTLPFL